MSASLVGSEMCIRDSSRGAFRATSRVDSESAGETGDWGGVEVAKSWSDEPQSASRQSAIRTILGS
eukprot:14277116-Alexandrium_andersonii.AAC.1